VVYAAFLPAGFLVQWRLGRAFPLAFLVYFPVVWLIAEIPPIKADLQRLYEIWAEYYAEVAKCLLGMVVNGIVAILLCRWWRRPSSAAYSLRK